MPILGVNGQIYNHKMTLGAWDFYNLSNEIQELLRKN
jgi:hypothetical protein